MQAKCAVNVPNHNCSGFCIILRSRLQARHTWIENYSWTGQRFYSTCAPGITVTFRNWLIGVCNRQCLTWTGWLAQTRPVTALAQVASEAAELSHRGSASCPGGSWSVTYGPLSRVPWNYSYPCPHIVICAISSMVFNALYCMICTCHDIIGIYITLYNMHIYAHICTWYIHTWNYHVM